MAPPLSEPAEKLLALLRSLPGGAICDPCTVKCLTYDLSQTLRATRELTLCRLVLADHANCSVCHRRSLVARLPFSR
jgi:hypothetical protein